jgi:ribosomal protein S18 acetylase RimI-like enzyme
LTGTVAEVDLEIRRATSPEEVAAADELFDGKSRPDWTRRFLDSPDHHLLVAYADGSVAGMVTGVETTHPDKGTEMFLYELGVLDEFQNRGIGRALVAALASLGRERGCYGMWVLTEHDNVAALKAYGAAGGVQDGRPVLLSWDFADGS